MRNTSLISLLFLLTSTFAAPSFSLAAALLQTPVTAQAPQPAEQYVLNMTTIYDREHPVLQEVLKPWAEDLLKQSGDRLFIRLYDAGSVASSSRMARAVKFGQVDIGCGMLEAEAQLFPLGSLAVQRPGTLAISELSGAYWRMFNELPELSAEFTGIKLLAVYAAGPDQICMVRGLPYDRSGVMGKRFLVSSPLSAMKMKALKAIPTVMPQNYFKMFLEDGVADGVVLSLTDLPQAGILPRIKGLALCDLGNSAVWFGMHQGDWEMLPQDLRKLLVQASGLPLSQALGASVARDYRSRLAALHDRAIAIHYFSAEERDKLELETQAAVDEAWQKLAQERGINARNLEERISKIMRESKVPVSFSAF